MKLTVCRQHLDASLLKVVRNSVSKCVFEKYRKSSWKRLTLFTKPVIIVVLRELRFVLRGRGRFSYI